MCVCVYVCVCVCMCVCLHESTYVSFNMYVYYVCIYYVQKHIAI